MLFTDKSLCAFPSFARKRRLSLCTLGGPKCLHRLMNSLKSLLFEPTLCSKVALKSARSTAVSFSAIHNNTSKRDLSCHAKISVTTTAPLSFLPASPTHQAEVAVGLLSLQSFSHSHMLVSQVGDRLPSPGIRWISDVNMWFSTLCPLWLLSALTSSPATTPLWVQFCAAVLGDRGATAAPATSIRCFSSWFSVD